MTIWCSTLWPVLVLGSAGTIAYALVLAHRLKRGLAAAPVVDGWAETPEPAGGWPSVCVVVPAHNEEGVIGRLAASLGAQDYPALRVVFALDRCTDGTRRVIESHPDERFEIIEIDHCPEDWAGKTHAAHQGWARSKAAQDSDTVLFTDADTWFAPRCVRASVAAMIDRGSDMLSLLSTLDAHHLWEHAMQPVAVMTLLRQHPLDRVNHTQRRRAFANGQFMLFRSEAYRGIGGHESVRGELLEDIALAFRCKNTGRPWSVLPAGSMLRCRMYDSRRAFLEGWKRIYMESARRLPSRLRVWGAELWLTGVGLPVVSLIAAISGPVCALTVGSAGGWVVGGLGLLALVLLGAVTGRIWRVQGARVWAVVLAPYGALVVGVVLLRAASDLTHRRLVRWGGREYRLGPRDLESL